MLSESPYASDEQVTAAIAGYEENKTALVRADPKKVTHVLPLPDYRHLQGI